MDTFAIYAIEPVDVVVDLRPQIVGNPFAYHGPLLARHRFEITLYGRVDRPPKGGIEIVLAGPVGACRGKPAQLQHRNRDGVHQPDGFGFEPLQAVAVRGDRPALDAKGIRNK